MADSPPEENKKLKVEHEEAADPFAEATLNTIGVPNDVLFAPAKPHTHLTPEELKQRMRVLQLKKSGVEEHEIAELEGISLKKVYRIIHQELRRVSRLLAAAGEEVKRLELQRLDWLTSKLRKEAERGNPRAIETILKIMERRAKMLGLDEPIKTVNVHDVNVVSLTDEEVDAELTRLGLLTVVQAPPSDPALLLPGYVPPPDPPFTPKKMTSSSPEESPSESE